MGFTDASDTVGKARRHTTANALSGRSAGRDGLRLQLGRTKPHFVEHLPQPPPIGVFAADPLAARPRDAVSRHVVGEEGARLFLQVGSVAVGDHFPIRRQPFLQTGSPIDELERTRAQMEKVRRLVPPRHCGW